MDASGQWQFDATLAVLSGEGRTLLRSLLSKLADFDDLRTRFEPRTPAPRGELVLLHGEDEIARVLLKPGALPLLAFVGEAPRELNGLLQTTQAAERIGKRVQELRDRGPQPGLSPPRR